MSLLAPGSVIGMLGGGQLGRMSIMAGRRLGYRFVVLDPGAGSCASMVADEQILAAYDHEPALRIFAEKVDRITLEFENIPGSSLAVLEPLIEVFPGKKTLEICQNRLREKRFLEAIGVPCAPFEVVTSFADLQAAVDRLGRPSVLKTADFGYDGKGQVKITEETDLQAAWAGYEGRNAVLEGWVNFEGEFSVICGRSTQGETCAYPVLHNVHRDHILFTSASPAGLTVEQESAAQDLALRIAEALSLVGVLAVELFLTQEGWIVNELAPRPHNSGHLTQDAHVTSQFEQHIRMISGMPPGSTRQMRPAVMLNLLGDIWATGRPDFEAILKDPECKLHLYDKGEPRAGRKMGHLTFIGDRVEDCLQRALAADRFLHGQ